MYSLDSNWQFTIMPFGIVAYAFMLLLDKLSRNTCMSRQRNSANEINFYREMKELKGHLKTKDSQKKCYLEDEFTTRLNIS